MSDVAALQEVLELVSKLGLRVRSVVVGGITLQLSQEWPAPAAIQAPLVQRDQEQAEEVRSAEKASDEELKSLRKRAQRAFGRIPPDEILVAMRGAL